MIAVGIDIAKKKIDIWIKNKLSSIANDEQALRKFFNPMQKDGVRIVMEATGRYHYLAHRILDQLGFDVMVINPFQSRHFAKSMNIFCKTDKVDAKVLSMYAERMDFRKTPVPSLSEEKLQDLIRHLDDLKSVLMQLNARIENSSGLVRESLNHLIDEIKNEIKNIKKAIEKLITSDKQIEERCKILTSIPGVGKATAGVLLGLLKELGSVSNKEACALAGVAPMNFDSGKFLGKRRIQRGRHDVRRFLYMPIIGAATIHNTVLKEFYQRLIAKGKPAKVALVACMRKLLTYANTLLRKNEIWMQRANALV